ncbi:MAG: ParA family protein [Kiritimatiellae bacterium]|nr:ParA family protein [Kiritimatiellia bacterium]
MGTRIIAIANQKGGVGKTTTTVNLAACLTVLKKNVLLIDLDPQANATSGVGLEKTPEMSIYKALLEDGRARDVIQATEYKRLDMIASELDLAGAEVDIARTDNYLHRLRNALADLKNAGLYDFILIDCPPSLGILTMNALTAAHSVLIPIQCEYYALEGLTIMTEIIRKLHQSGANPELDIEGIVMTMYDMRTNLSQAVVQEVSQHFGDKIYETLIPRTVRLSEAPSFGKPIIAYDSRSTGAVAYLQLAKEVIARCKAEDARAAAEESASTPLPASALSPEVSSGA